ncbi:uncharacterized protein (DUF2236 family) [Psychromicrobium silvestre]|uniref:Uncharacterized protein (DUF2236 family) n=1 Tax=Psychromicrobium silvestre TaxID=1645614 RepID=A0A7Y9LVC2_9MICC|nr:oxygenase MpaB family protein [Psychromicrobium silvestre]NYE96210.1 uncharacterized protein (DUF2236 family) [Psychromicrobium silvestre]
MSNPIRRWQAELKKTFTGHSESRPAWVEQLEEGEDAGYFLPTSVVWTVHSSMTTIVAGVRALLLQALHPGALAGVWDHSRFREDPLGRLAGTIRWIFTVTYGSTGAARGASKWVLRLHESVRGNFVDGHGVARPYSAADPELLRWVHIAFTDAFLSSYQAYGSGRISADDYVREWAVAGELMEVSKPPRSELELREALAKYDGELRSDERVAEVVAFIRRPPLHPSMRLGYKVIFAAAVETLQPEHRRLLGLRRSRFWWLLKPGVRVLLGIIRLALGRVGPSEQAALRRIKRLRATVPGNP